MNIPMFSEVQHFDLMEDSDSDEFLSKISIDYGLPRHYSIQVTSNQNGLNDISVPDFLQDDALSADDAQGKDVHDPHLEVQGVGMFKKP